MARILILLTLILNACFFTACGGGGDKQVAAELGPRYLADDSWYQATPEEAAAIARGEDPEADYSFGDPQLGAIGISSPPPLNSGVYTMVDGVDAPTSARGVSSGKKGKKPYKKGDPCGRCGKKTCQTPNDCDDVTIVGICNLSERFHVICDCCDQFAEVCYTAKVLFSREDCDKSGVEVVFKRGGEEVGRAETDAEGMARFCEDRVPRGKHQSRVCVWTGQDWIEDGKTSGGKKGKNKNDGKDNCPCDGNAGKGNDWKCGDCGKPGGGDDGAWLCADLEVVVYMTCYRGIWWGKGLINGKKGHMAMFNFRNPYENGNFQGKLTYVDGPIQIIEEEITWMVVDIESAWFGNGKWMARMWDHGQDHLNGDWFEIYIWETATTPEYYNKGYLLNCFTTASFAFTHKCPGGGVIAKK